MFDSHCHLHGDRMRGTAEQAVLRARAAGVSGFCLAGVGPIGWRYQLELARKVGDCGISYGVHPQLVAEATQSQCLAAIDELDSAVGRGGSLPRPNAIGEIGLDTVTDSRKRSLPLQEQAFVEQLRIAREVDLPVILHILGPHGLALSILRREGVPEAGGVVHSYSGSAQLVSDYVGLGLHISFAGGVTRAQARKVHAAAKAVPEQWLLVETDAPDQTPEPHQPAANEPAFLPAVVEAVARARGQSAEAVAQFTEHNARRLYGM